MEERKAPYMPEIDFFQITFADLVDYVVDKDFLVNVISKSGTTTEPAKLFAFSKIYHKLEK